MATLSRVWASWERFWFPAVPLERLAVFRILVSLFAFVDVAQATRYMLAYPEVDAQFFAPVYTLEVFASPLIGIHPVPPLPVFAGLVMLLLCGLAAATVGYRTRLALWVAAPLYLYYWSLFNSWGKINHGKIPVIFALLVLVIAPAGARLSIDAMRRSKTLRPLTTHDRVAGWALRFVGTLIVLSYMLSVVAKLQNTGLAWPFQPILASYLGASTNPIAQFFAQQSRLLVAMQVVTITVESVAFLAFTGGWRRNLILATLAIFHLASFVLLGTEFFGFLICYAVFFRLEDGVRWLRDQMASSRRSVRGGV